MSEGGNEKSERWTKERERKEVGELNRVRKVK